MRVPISLKLVTMTVTLLLGVTVIIAYTASNYFQDTSLQREESINVDFALAKGVNIQNELINLNEKIINIGTEVYQSLLISNNNGSNLNLVRVIESLEKTKNIYSYQIKNIKGETLWSWESKNLKNKNTFRTSSLGINLALQKKIFYYEPLPYNDERKEIRVYFPLVQDSSRSISYVGIVDLSIEFITQHFRDLSERHYFIVDDYNRILFHSLGLNYFNHNMGDHEIVSLARQSSAPGRGQKLILDPILKDKFYTSYFRTQQNWILGAQVSEKLILEPAQAVKRRILFIGGIVLSVSIFLVFLFSLTLTSPIERLAKLMDLVKSGTFKIDASQKIASILPDEVNDLASAVDQMAEGLAERDKVKSLFSKFVGSSVTDDLLKREVALGGARKDIVVFFSDIRGFTSLSETIPPEEVVEMLNEYFGAMVKIINQTGGVVDKFIGDAIMAVWGAPNSLPNDAQRAVLACLKMRMVLEEINEKRLGEGKNPLMIGMGLHYGPAVAGTIGSDERMEYTVIGNTVNTSSRIEAATKSFGTDLLLSEEIYLIVKEEFIIELAGEVQVKGRSEILKLYKVLGLIKENGEREYLQTAYSDYESEDADKVKIKKEESDAA